MTPTIIVTIGVGIFAGLCGAGGLVAWLRWRANHKIETEQAKITLETAEQTLTDKIRSQVRDEYQQLVAVKNQMITALVASAKEAAERARCAAEDAAAARDMAAKAASDAASAAAIAARDAATAAALAARDATLAVAEAARQATLSANDANSKAMVLITTSLASLQSDMEGLQRNQADIQSDLEKIICLLEAVAPPVPPEVSEALVVAKKHRRQMVKDSETLAD